MRRHRGRRPGGRRYRIVGGSANPDHALTVECDEIVLATPPYATARILDGLAAPALIEELNRFEYLPITTAYLGWPEHRLGAGEGPPALLALNPSGTAERHAQWFFDRGVHAHWRIAALVISDSRKARELGDERLADALVRQVVHEMGLPAPEQLSLIHEKRATIACTPDRPRLSALSIGGQLPGIVLAGDYTYADYPATLEGAVRSGRIAARRCCARPAPRHFGAAATQATPADAPLVIARPPPAPPRSGRRRSPRAPRSASSAHSPSGR